MLLWLGAYICIWLSGYISMSRRRVPTSFSQCFVSLPLQLPCQKDQPGYRCFDSKLPASSFSVMCSQARMYEINYIDRRKNNHKIKIAVASWQSAVGSYPFDCEYTNILIVLTACTGGRGVCEKVGCV